MVGSLVFGLGSLIFLKEYSILSLRNEGLENQGRRPKTKGQGPVEMNIGITVYPTYGGSGIVGSELGKELAARGHTVHFISSALPTRLTELNERVRFHEVEMMSYPL